MAIESGPSIAPAITPTAVGGEVSAGIGTLSSFSSISNPPEFSSFVPDSPVSSLKGFYPIEGTSTGVNEGPVSSRDVSFYPIVIAQAPEVTLTEDFGMGEKFTLAGFEKSSELLAPPIYSARETSAESKQALVPEPNLPGSDIEFSLPSRDLLDDVGFSSNFVATEVPRGMAASLESITLDPDQLAEYVSGKIDQTASDVDFQEKEILYSEAVEWTDREGKLDMLSGTENSATVSRVEEIIGNVTELDLTEDQAKKIETVVLERTKLVSKTSDLSAEIYPEAVIVGGELAEVEPLVVVEQAMTGEVAIDDLTVKNSEQIQVEQAIKAFSAAHFSISEVEKILQPVVQARGLAIVKNTNVEDEEELTEPESQELQGVLIGARIMQFPALETPIKSERLTSNLVAKRLQKIRELHFRRAEKAARSRLDALKTAIKEAFEKKAKDPSAKTDAISGAEIVSHVDVPMEKVKSPVNPGGPEEGWALTLKNVASQNFQSQEQAIEYARRQIYEETQPVETAEKPKPPVSLRELQLAISNRKDPQNILDAAKVQRQTLPLAA